MFGISGFLSSKRISRAGALFAGGFTNGNPNQISNIQKFYFAIEAAGDTGATLPTATYAGWGATKIDYAGYKLCGYGYDGNNAYATGSDCRIQYATNTVTNLGSLYGSATKINHAQGSDNGTKSLALSGYDVAISGWSGAGKKFLFASESASSTSASITGATMRGGTFTMSNSSVALYVAGGMNGSWYCSTTQTDKVNYSTETSSYLYMPDSKLEDTSGSAVSDSGNKGYAMAGFKGDCSNGANGVGNSYVVSYANDTYSTIAQYVWGAEYPGAVSKQGVAGYVLGGRSSGTIQKMAFASNAVSSLASSVLSPVGWPVTMAESLGN